jgi:hypothetical protein
MRFLAILAIFLVGNCQEGEELVTLNEDNFEHLTQVATGATTGDWFVLFHKGSAECCQKWIESWTDLAYLVRETSELQLSIAKVDGTSNPELVRRFNVSMPSALYFRLGKLYRVSVKPDAPQLLKFVKESGYKSFKPEAVPKQLTIFSDFSLSSLKTYPFNLILLSVIIVAALVKLFKPKTISEAKKSN